MIKSPKIFFKLFFFLLLAFIVSQLLVTKVTFKENPVLRPSFQQFVHNLSTKAVDQVRTIVNLPKKIFIGNQNPPPWIEPIIKPTIIAYKPPVFYPSTSTPKPTSFPDYTPTPPHPTSTLSPNEPTPLPGQPTFTPIPTSTPVPLPTSTPIPPTPPPAPPSQAKSELLSIINSERQKNGIGNLNFNTALGNAAQAHADDMYQNNYFSHTGRDGSSPSDRAIRAGYPTRSTGENIAAGTTSPSYIFNMWMGSTGHRQNMLNPTWKSAGIGLAGNIWVLLLGAK